MQLRIGRFYQDLDAPWIYQLIDSYISPNKKVVVVLKGYSERGEEGEFRFDMCTLEKHCELLSKSTAKRILTQWGFKNEDKDRA